MRIEAVIFDMDGLMLDTESIYFKLVPQAAEMLGYPPSDELPRLMMGTNHERCKATARKFYGEEFPYDELADICAKLTEEIYAREGVPVKAGVVELLEYLKSKGIPCGVASSTYAEKGMRLLRGAGIDGYFTDFVFGDMVEKSKPEPDIFLAAAKTLGMQPRSCMGLEDSPSGLAASKAAGLYTVMVPDMLKPDQELLDMIDGCVTTLHDIIPLIERLNA